MKTNLFQSGLVQTAVLVVAGLLLGQSNLAAQSATGWTGASDGFFSNAGNWTNGIPNSGLPAARILNFGPLGNARPNVTNDMNNLSGHRIFFNSGATTYTLYLQTGTGGTTLNDFGGNQPQIQNDSASVQTIDMSFKMQAKGISGAANQAGVINPTVGDLVFTTNCTLTLITNTQLRFFSSQGHTVTFNGPVLQSLGVTNSCALMTAGSGGTGPTVVFANTNSCTNTFINCGTVRLATNNVTSFQFTLGDTNAANAPAAFLLLDNGLTNNSPLVIQTLQPSGANSKTIGNTAVGSGFAPFTGPVSLGTNLTTSANPAGTLEFDGNFDFQNPSGTGPRTLTVSGSGDTVFTGSFTNASTGSSVLTKTNSGTLTLVGGTNSLRILFRHGGGVISISSSNTIGIPNGVNYPDKFNFTDNATLRATNSFTLGRQVSGSDNAGFRINGGKTGTFDILAASTLTIDGPIIDIPSSGAGNLTKIGNGTLVLQQTNTYSGATVVSAGTLQLLASGSIANTPTITVESGAALDVASVTGGFTLGANQTLKGNGTINGVVAVSGTIAPGSSIGTLTFSSAPTLSGTNLMEIDRNAGSPLADKVVLTSGTLTYGGTLTVVNVGAALQLNDTFDFFDAGSFGSLFSFLNLPALPTGLAWDTSQLVVDGTIKVACDGTLSASAGVAQAICPGGSVGIGGSPTAIGGSGTGFNYSWNPSTGLSSASVANPTASPTGTTSYTVTITDTNGCTAQSSVLVTVNSLPTTSAISGSALVQSNQSGVTYSVTLTSGSSYAWTVPSGAAITTGNTGPNNNSITVDFGTADSGNVAVTETNAAGCVGTAVSLAVTVNHPPTASDKSYTRLAGSNLFIAKADLLVGAGDPDSGDSVSFDALASTGSQGATVSENATGILYEPTNNNSDTLQFRVKDTQGGTVTKNILIAVDNSSAGGIAQSIIGSPSSVTVTFAGIPTLKYDVQRDSDTGFPSPTLIVTTNAPGNGIFSVTDTSPPSPSFYRLKFNPN